MDLARVIIFAALLALGVGCQSTGRTSLTQVSTIDALLVGMFDGHTSIRTLRQAGDFGIGTFDGLDGEMIVLDGVVYKAQSDGKVVRVSDAETTPFATVSYFRPEIAVNIHPGVDYHALEAMLGDALVSPNVFHAVRVDGEFAHVQVRSVPAQRPPYRPLIDVVKEQSVYEFEEVRGTLVGYYVPAFGDRINVPGFHLHFITDDRTRGGHVLALTSGNATALIDPLYMLRMVLPDTGEFLHADLTGDQTEARDVVERGR